MMIRVTNLSKHFKIPEPGVGVIDKLRRLVTPHYKIIKAVDDISLTIEKGEIVGYLGPNGAGKSTTIKLLTGVLYPTDGEIEVNGIVPHQNRIANAYNIGVVYGQRSQLWWDLPLMDSFEILAAMYKVPDKQYHQTRDFLVELLEMQEFLDQPVRKLSLGQRMKGDIVASLLHAPSILYLDEPTIGLDVVSKNHILRFLQDLNAEKKTTIILTTHNLSDVERICPRIMIIDKGKIILDAIQAEILARFGQQRQLIIEFEEGIQDIDIPEGELIRQEGNKIWIAFNRNHTSAFDMVNTLGTYKGIKDIAIQEADIESIVTQIYEYGLNGERIGSDEG
jgi:ABC-2 type transport system ATP-binding protein